MFFKSLRLENVRCFKDVELSCATERVPNRKWTLLVGDNGSGKTTLLRSIGLLMGGSDALPDLLGDPESWIRNGADSCRMSATLTTARGEERRIALTIKRDSTLRSLFKENAKSMALLDEALEHTNRNYLTIGYGASRHLSESGVVAAPAFRNPRARSVGTLFAPHVPLVAFETWAMELQERRSKAGVKILRDALDGLLPQIKFKSIDKRTQRVLFDTPDGVVPLRQLGDGYQSVIGAMGDLLAQVTYIFDDFKNPLSARGLLLIDELGLHLHPVWQRQLLYFLTTRLPRLQLIVTSNSPFMAHQLNEGELLFLRRHKGVEGPTLHHFEGAPNKLLLHQLILSPVFGVATANSHDMELLRMEYDELNAKRRQTPNDKKRMRKLRKTLADVTPWDEVTESDRQLKQLLGEIRKNLPGRK